MRVPPMNCERVFSSLTAGRSVDDNVIGLVGSSASAAIGRRWSS